MESMDGMRHYLLKKWVRPLLVVLLGIGINPRAILALRYWPRYLAQSREFKRLGGVIARRHRVLTDYGTQAGSGKGHYFHQDLLVAGFVHDRNPQRHIDVGSRIDGFVAHVASFREIEVLDVRDLEDCGHPTIRFIRADLMDADESRIGIADSISSLHALEHFGLGRYGDPLDPEGHVLGFNNIIDMLKPGGRLYVSFPIGRVTEVHFNAHRVFHPKSVLNWARDPSALRLERFDYVDDQGRLHSEVDLENDRVDVVFGCGIYTFAKA